MSSIILRYNIGVQLLPLQGLRTLPPYPSGPGCSRVAHAVIVLLLGCVRFPASVGLETM